MPASTIASATSTIITPFLIPTLPIHSSRYELAERKDYTRRKPEKFPAGNGQRDGLDEHMHNLGSLPQPWIQYIHPDGKPYFRHPVWNVVTEANIREPEIHEQLEAWYGSVNSLASPGGVKAPKTGVPGSIELYLTLGHPHSYYYVDHGNRTIFWLQDIHLSQLDFNIAEGLSLEMWLQQNYYSHLENFPCHKELPDDASALLRGTLAYACTDHLTSYKSATAPWNADDCKSLLEILDGLEAGVGILAQDAIANYKTWFVARLLTIIFQSRVVHRYGMIDACTDRLQHARASPEKFSGCFGIIAGALSFWAHPTYVARLDVVWAGGMVSLSGWQDLLGSLLVEWSESNLLATVILSANMAFLALSEVGSTERASSVISTFFSIGSIATGLHHIWRHRVKKDSQLGEAATYLTHTDRSRLAFFLSVPLIFLLWSLVTFGCAVAVFAFSHSRPWAAYAFTGTVFGIVLYVIGHTVFFFMSVFKKTDEPTS